jgi:hypothetical protein
MFPLIGSAVLDGQDESIETARRLNGALGERLVTSKGEESL